MSNKSQKVRAFIDEDMVLNSVDNFAEKARDAAVDGVKEMLEHMFGKGAPPPSLHFKTKSSKNDLGFFLDIHFRCLEEPIELDLKKLWLNARWRDQVDGGRPVDVDARLRIIDGFRDMADQMETMLNKELKVRS